MVQQYVKKYAGMHIIIRIPAYLFILFCLKQQVNSPVNYIIIEWYSRARIIVSKPDTPIAMPLMAPSISPSCMARLVPMAWLHVPIATPAAMGLFTWKNLISVGARIEPMIPVAMTTATVTDVMPPSS